MHTKIRMEQLTVASNFFLRLFSQFTVLDEDALSELVSFFEDLLIVDVGHGGDEALKE